MWKIVIANSLVRFLLMIIPYCIYAEKFEFIHHIHNNPYMNINADALTITSLIVNPTIKHSSWIKSLFGSKSMFWYKASNIEVDSKGKLSYIEKNNGKRLVNEFIRSKLPNHAYSSTCSIEILGYVKLDKQQPFFLNNKYKYPPTGYGKVHIYNHKELSKPYLFWTCSYRALYDNWRDGEEPATEPNYWPIVLYCYPPPPNPFETNKEHTATSLKDATSSLSKNKNSIPSLSNGINNRSKEEDMIQSNSCADLNNRFHETIDSLSMNISLFLTSKHITWKAYVMIPKYQWTINASAQEQSSSNASSSISTTTSTTTIAMNQLHTSHITSNQYHQYHNHSNHRKHNAHDVAVCTCLPYETSDVSKLNSIGEIFKEFVRYYAKLNMKVFVYDRHGNKAKFLFNQLPSGEIYLNYYNDIKDNKMIQKNLYYHNYTILSILDNNQKHGWQYDNVDSTNDDILRFDNDHTLTLTHCRFDVKAKFGIENVITVDFDEFFYCPKGGVNPHNQSRYQKKYLQRLRQMKYDQVSFLQRTVANRSVNSISSCVMQKSKELQYINNRMNSNQNDIKDHISITNITNEMILNSNSNNDSNNSLKSNLPSIFDCFSPIRFDVDDFSPKSIHLSHLCPLTTDHHACSLPNQPRMYDCPCRSIESEECTMIHLTIRDSDYNKKNCNTFPYDAYKDEVIELWNITNSIID